MLPSVPLCTPILCTLVYTIMCTLHSNTVHSCAYNNMHSCHTRKVPHQGVFRINVARTYNLHSLSTIHTHFAQLAFTLSTSHSLCTNYSLSTQFTVTHTNYIHSAQLFNECKPSFRPHHFHLTGGSRRAAVESSCKHVFTVIFLLVNVSITVNGSLL